MPATASLYSVNGRHILGLGIAGSSADRSAAAAAAQAATVALSAVAGVGYVLGGIFWSYSGPPTGGRLTVESGSSTLLDLDITQGGPDSWTPAQPMLLAAGTTALITLAGAAGVTGKVNCTLWRL